MKTDDKIRDEKLQCNINRVTVLPSGKTNRYECLRGEEILPSDQSKMIE